MLPPLLLVSRSPWLCPGPLDARSATGCWGLGLAVVPLASSGYMCTHQAIEATQRLTAEPTLCMAAICVPLLYPAINFRKACRNTVSLRNLSSLANGIRSYQETTGV